MEPLAASAKAKAAVRKTGKRDGARRPVQVVFRTLLSDLIMIAPKDMYWRRTGSTACGRAAHAVNCSS